MRVLAIGNSFSTDATAYIERIALDFGVKMTVRNLFIGGCSLEQHVQNLKTKEKEYEYQKNGECIRFVNLDEAIQKPWDVVTVQQVSYLSGVAESYEPYLTTLIQWIRKSQPQAKIVFHRTWPYESDSDHPEFFRYDFSRLKMFRAILEASNERAAFHHLQVIPAGDVIEYMRDDAYFCPEKGGIALSRDGFHLSFLAGRWIAALVWVHFLTGIDVSQFTWSPEGVDEATIRHVRIKMRAYLDSLAG